ncbi:MAG: SirB2 family protein [Inhella sp.]|jgi:uncharacterized membrane protein SirB2|uniref:SirB2 family protein n=1 Tax=Inhella sp. TaxID=1921806 RepID=UPI0022BCAF8D|nr:SirB2 family protein [Inhella sp.]MCZ8235294.1 SirB2 family protein [Inhella sp.]
MLWYTEMLEMHRWLAVGSVLVFALRALDVIARTRWLSEGTGKVMSVLLDVPLAVSGLSLWGLLQTDPWVETWLLMKFALLFAYLALGALALRAKTRESALLALILALTCMGLLFGVALTRDPFMGPWN